MSKANRSQFQVIRLTFTEQAKKTVLTMHMLFASVEARIKAIEEVGAVAGANSTLDRLEAHLANV